jgi:diacylglycerol kinase family enzyme
MFGLDQNVYQNLETILKGKVKKVDICYLNNAPFVYVACLGDYIDLAYATPRALKEKYGKLAYFIYGVQQAHNSLHHYDIRFKVDGKEYEGTYSFIFISNSSRIAGQPDVYYDVKLDDNKFEVALANPRNKKELLRLIAKIDTMDVANITEIIHYKTNHFEIDFLEKPKTSWCIDGEEYKEDTLHYEFHVNQDMKMLVPRENIKSLFEDK